MKKLIYSLIFLATITGCSLNQDSSNVFTPEDTTAFGIYFADTNQPIFSDADLSQYDATTHTFTFTDAGAAKLQAYQPTNKLGDGLYQKAFIAKLGNTELYRGKFWSNASSAGETGIVMTDVLFIGPDYPTLTVTNGYPSEDLGSSNNAEALNDDRLVERFRTIHKLK